MKIGTLALATSYGFHERYGSAGAERFLSRQAAQDHRRQRSGRRLQLLFAAAFGLSRQEHPRQPRRFDPASAGLRRRQRHRLSRQCRAERRHGDRRRHAELLRHPLRRTERREVQSGPVPLPRPDERFRTRAGELACDRREDHRRSEGQGNLRRGIGAPLDHVDPADTPQRNPWHQDEGHHRIHGLGSHSRGARTGRGSGHHHRLFDPGQPASRLAARQEGQHHRRARLHRCARASPRSAT